MHFSKPLNGQVTISSESGETLTWQVRVFDSTKMSGNEDPFREINGFLAELSAHRRVKIFGIYKRIHHEITESYDTNSLAAKLTLMVKELYENIPAAELEHWLEYHGGIQYRDTLKDKHDADDKNPDRTYLKSDYKALVTLSTQLRFMIPIWGEYIPLLKQSVGSRDKEYIAMHLLRQTEIPTSPAINRLFRYIEGYVKGEVSANGEPKMDSAIINNLSSAEVVEWVLAHAVVRRLAGGEVDANEAKGDLISNIYGHVKSILKTIDTKYGGVRSKYGNDADQADEISFLERWRTTQTITTGEQIGFTIFVRDVYNSCKGVDPTIPDELIKSVIDANKDLSPTMIQPHHVVLSQWVMSKVIAPQAIPTLQGIVRIKVMMATQAIITHWGFPVLGLLATASLNAKEENTFEITDNRDQVSRATVEILNQLYPHTDRAGANTRQANQAYVAISQVAKLVRSDIWRVRVPKGVEKDVQYCVENNRRMIVPPGIAEMLAQLVVHNAMLIKAGYQEELLTQSTHRGEL